MISNHFYTKYGLALLFGKENISNIWDISTDMLKKEIQNGLAHFRIRPNTIETDGKVKYNYVKENYLLENPRYIKKHCDEGYFLSPNIITKDLQASNSWNTLQKMKKELDNNQLTKSSDATMSKIPITSKFNNGRRSQSVPKASLLEVCLCLIVTTTPNKPCLHSREKGSYISNAIIPDLGVEELVKFIALFNEMHRTQTKNLMLGKVEEKDGKRKFYRPNLSNGNFPNAPKRSELASAALLGAIGKFAKEAEYPNTDVEEVLEKLKSRPLYIVSYGKAQSVTYTHYIVDLAKENKLSDVIDALGRFSPYISDRKNQKSIQQKYDNFFLFASRFLQLFDRQSFKEFLSVRGEYPSEIKILFKTFYRSVMKINNEIIDSAIALGHWLNQIAYFAAANEFKGKSKQEVYDAKAKIIVELESAVHSAKTPTALVFQVITRAGRISKQDAPNESQLFIKKVISSELGETEKVSFENAKNMITAFSRIRSLKSESTPDFEIPLIEDEQLTEEEN